MVYALTLFLPQIIFEVVVFIQLLISAPVIKSIKAKSSLTILFTLTFITVIVSNYTI